MKSAAPRRPLLSRPRARSSRRPAASGRSPSRPNRCRTCRSLIAASRPWRRSHLGAAGTTAQGTQNCMSTECCHGRRLDDGWGEQAGAAIFNRASTRSPFLRSEGLSWATRRNTDCAPACKLWRSPKAEPTVLTARSTTSAGTRSGTRSSKANNSNGVPKPVSKAQDTGFSVGGLRLATAGFSARSSSL